MAGSWQTPWGLSVRDISSEVQGSKTLTRGHFDCPPTQRFCLSVATLICESLSLSPPQALLTQKTQVNFCPPLYNTVLLIYSHHAIHDIFKCQNVDVLSEETVQFALGLESLLTSCFSLSFNVLLFELGWGGELRRQRVKCTALYICF